MSIPRRSRLIVFVLALAVWLALTGARDVQDLLAGIVCAGVASLAAGRFVITSHAGRGILVRTWAALRFFFRFLWEMIKANLHVAYLVAHPAVPIRPGIVKVKTSLSNEMSLTLLSNAITLTPGTLTVDVNPERGELYVHWIDLSTTDPSAATAIIGGRFEALLEEVFE